ncbi:hypothetical protein [Silvibacterium dinghuense]|uniref:Uncharacterized protein n=1 Tax=Silvibacterium dinghuense TaxID=1560006 RepID=A0A4Q1SDC8_9BACT|nr:hypothetical protein [Silvibacterium dinghuense]RXS95103.1 hypothetical protein ESZ00_10825 [Silvibacterium dinghuense]GGH10616.1 hypothetical protein GCM10011586_29050 [Silvibacterium dinghuense]
MTTHGESTSVPQLPNGAGAAALFSAGFGVFVLSVLAIIGDQSAAFKKLMIFYLPTGPLSGVTTIAVAAWIVSWVGLDLLWRRSDSKGWAIMAGIALLAIGFVLMIPPVGDLF